MKREDVKKYLQYAEKYGAASAKVLMNQLQPEETPEPKSENQEVADMIQNATKKIVADRKENEEAQIRKNLITWGR